MSATECALAADTKVETPEGAMAIRTLAGKGIPVFTLENARIRFRMTHDVRKVAEQQPVIKVTLDNGASFRVSPDQIVLKKGMIECRANALQAGDQLESAFYYPQQYEFKDDTTDTTRASEAGLRVTAIEPSGTADLFTLGVNQTGCFFLAAGVLCKAEGTQPRPVDTGTAPPA